MNKSPDAFRTISEVADDLGLPQHVLRFWETRFSQIKPLKRGGGRRYYRPDDVDLLRGIKHLLYEEGYTIRGLQRILKEQGNKFVVSVGRGDIEVGLEAASTNTGSKSSDAGSDIQGESEESDAENENTARSGKRAVSVSEITEPKSKGFMKKLRGTEKDAELSGTGSGLSSDDRRSLQSTLYELLECKRLLDQVRGD
ncbi:MAG: MerR family transcriptional regulator [Rhizobiaceae bacterium]